METGVVLTIGFAIFMVLMISGFIVGLTYLSYTAQTTTTSTTPTTSTTTTSTTLEESTITSSLAPSTTSTTLAKKKLTLSVAPAKLYLLDDATLKIEGDGVEAERFRVYLNGTLAGETLDGKYEFISLNGGTYPVLVESDSFDNASTTFIVNKDTYATSKDVLGKLTDEQRRQAIDGGKVDIRFYESSFCNICDVVRGQLSKVVNNNRQCVVYERLSVFRYPEEVIAGSYPTIVVEGRNGIYKDNGLVSMSKVKQMIESASGCDVR